ncbi:hypothetical protein [Nocardioides sp. GY 10113]|uniref:hypothetical protein n=1 Tax=Nocardioides sp. GY 10113 TaxID=2569761 RepID=UPI001457EC1F|nr:hypothetical protein [Nocardioides sp. GY 10113]
MIVLHLRLDPKVMATKDGASFDGIKATYTTDDGESGEFIAPDPDFRARRPR